MFIISILFYILTFIFLTIAFFLFYLRPRHPVPKGCYVVPVTKWQERLFGQMYNFLVEPTMTPQNRWAKAALASGHKIVTYEYSYGKRVAWIYDLEDAQYLLTGDAEYKHTKHSDYQYIAEMIDPVYHGLVTIRDIAFHTAQKKLVLPAFASKALRSIANYVFPKHAVELDKDLMKISEECRPGGAAEGKGVGLGPALEKFTLNIVVESAFKKLSTGGIDIPANFKKQGEILSLHWSDLFPHSIRPYLPVHKRRVINETVGNIGRAADIMGDEAEKQYANGEVKEGTEVLLDYLVREKGLSRGQRRAHASTFLAAASDTTARALQWTCYFLAKNPKIQEKLFDSLVDAVGLHTQPSLDDLLDVQYLDLVIKESLRLRPPAGFTGRDALEDITLPNSGVKIPKDMRIVFPIFNLHRHPDVWGTDEEDVETFRPERWEDDELIEKLKKYPAAYLPFMLGHRACTGKLFSLHEQKIALACIVRSYVLSWPKGQSDPIIKYRVTLGPAVDPKIIIRERSE